jgi:hypothetical protein
LIVDLKAAGTGKLAWRAKIEGVLGGDTDARIKVIDQDVVALFGTYPTRKPQKK